MVACAMLKSHGFLAVFALAACAQDTTILLSDFDTSCAKDQDCIVVQTGNICGCDCGNSAINVKGSAAYQSEFDDKGTHCTAKTFCGCSDFPSAVCRQGQCAFVAP